MDALRSTEHLTHDWPTVGRPVAVDLPEDEPTSPATRLGDVAALDPVIGRLGQVADAVPERARAVLSGAWLGHPVHPLLTDLAIGFWTSAWVLDIVGGRRSAPAATTLVGLGVVSALPTAASGLVDWRDIDKRPDQRVGVVHAVANVTATGLYAASFAQRCRGRRGRGVVTGMLAAGVATVGGYLGGHLAFGSS